MPLRNFADLLAAAHAEPEPQRRLLVIARYLAVNRNGELVQLQAR